MSAAPLPAARLAAYAAFALPLAMAVLPVYVHVPKLYADELGLPLAAVGLVLFGARLLDAIQDPLVGWWSDRRAALGHGRLGFIVAAVLLLGCGLPGLFHPPEAGRWGLMLWLSAMLGITYLGLSLGAISYFALGAELSSDYHQRTRVTAFRGAAGVVGVVAAATLPEALVPTHGPVEALRLASLAFVPVLVLGAAVTLFGAPEVTATPHAPVPLAQLWRPLRHRDFRWLLAVSMASGVAAAIPATLILFYVQDVLDRPDLNALYLGLYFLFGALGMPLWVRATRHLGKRGAWLLGMGMSIAAFVWAYALGPGDALPFALVCALSGLAYGAELSIPPSLLADVVGAGGAGGPAEGAYFGFWQLTEKLNLALAAGLALPLLGLAGYQPGTAQPPMGNLSMMYALVPCLLKLGAAALLWSAPLDRGTPVPTTGGNTP